MLEGVGVDALKIASGDLTFDALIAHAARTGLPLIMSTGMSTLAETAHAVSRRARARRPVSWRSCTACRRIPVPEGSQNLRAIQTLARVFGTPVGLSDHASRQLCGAGRRRARRVDLRAPSHAARRRRRRRGRFEHARADSRTLSRPRAARRRRSGHGRRECLPAEAVNLTASRRALHATRAPGCRRHHRGGRHRGAAPLARVAAESETRARGNDRGARDRGRRAVSRT